MVIACFGARRGLVSTAIKTADAGYLTRRLVDMVGDFIVREKDCGTSEGLTKEDLLLLDRSSRFSLFGSYIGRFTANTIYDREGEVVIPRGTFMDLDTVARLSPALSKLEKGALYNQDKGPQVLKVRHFSLCQTRRGFCQMCYGMNPVSTRLRPVPLGQALGLDSALSLTEPITQGVLSAFHSGGTVGGGSELGEWGLDGDSTLLEGINPATVKRTWPDLRYKLSRSIGKPTSKAVNNEKEASDTRYGSLRGNFLNKKDELISIESTISPASKPSIRSKFQVSANNTKFLDKGISTELPPNEQQESSLKKWPVQPRRIARLSFRVPMDSIIRYKIPRKAKEVKWGYKNSRLGLKLEENVEVIFASRDQTVKVNVPSGEILVFPSGDYVSRSQPYTVSSFKILGIKDNEIKFLYNIGAGGVFMHSGDLPRPVLEGNVSSLHLGITRGRVIFDDDLKVDSNLTVVREGCFKVYGGDRYKLPPSYELLLKLGSSFTPSQPVVRKRFTNTVSGIVNFDEFSRRKLIKIFVFRGRLNNSRVYNKGIDKFPKLTVETTLGPLNFSLNIREKSTLKPKQVIGFSPISGYQAVVGGRVFYFRKNIYGSKKRRVNEESFNGSIFFVPQETYHLGDSEMEGLKVKQTSKISKGDRLSEVSNISSKIDGIVIIESEKGLVHVKPGVLFEIPDWHSFAELKRPTNRFVSPQGKNLFRVEGLSKIIEVTALSYLEFFRFDGQLYGLVTPVTKYVYAETARVDTVLPFFYGSKNRGPVAYLSTIVKPVYSHGALIKPNCGLDLLRTYLVFNMSPNYAKLGAHLEYLPLDSKSNHESEDLNCSKNSFPSEEDRDFPTSDSEEVGLGLVCFEALKATHMIIDNFRASKKVFNLVANNSYVEPNTILAAVNFFPTFSGMVLEWIPSQKVLELVFVNYAECLRYPGEKSLVKVGDEVRLGSFITPEKRATCPGLVVYSSYTGVFILPVYIRRISVGRKLLLRHNQILHAGQPLGVFMTKASWSQPGRSTIERLGELLELRKVENPCVQAPDSGIASYHYDKRGNLLITITTVPFHLPSEKLVLNAGKKVEPCFRQGSRVDAMDTLTSGGFDYPAFVRTCWTYYRRIGVSMPDACRRACYRFLEVMVPRLESGFRRGGVGSGTIDVHLFAWSMIAKVEVLDGGDTDLVPGEYFSIKSLEKIDALIWANGGKTPTYAPLVLGMSKVSMISGVDDGFLRSACFREAGRVLFEAAIEGRKDWVLGIKEGMIVGRLLPFGAALQGPEKRVLSDVSHLGTPELVKRAIACSPRIRLSTALLKLRIKNASTQDK
jgi:hypothetical protein